MITVLSTITLYLYTASSNKNPSNEDTFVACSHAPFEPPQLCPVVSSGGFQVHAGFLLEGCTTGFHARRLFAARRGRIPCIECVVASCSMCPARPEVYLEWCRKLQDEVIDRLWVWGNFKQQILMGFWLFFVSGSHQRNGFR